MEEHEQPGPSADERLDEANRLWQSRFDKLRGEKKDLEERLNQATAVDRESAEREARYARRERVFNLAVDKGIDPKLALDVLLGDGDDEDRLAGLQKTIQDGVDAGVDQEVARRFKDAPKPAGGLAPFMPSWDQIQALPEDELQRLGPQAIAAAASRENAEKSSLRSRIQERLGMTRNAHKGAI